MCGPSWSRSPGSRGRRRRGSSATDVRPSPRVTPPSSRPSSKMSPLLVGRDDVHQLGVDRRAVQALVVVLLHDLPVGLDVDRRDVPDAQLTETDAGQPEGVVLLVGEVLEQRPGLLAREVDEDEALPLVDVDRPEPGVLTVDLVGLDHRGAAQRSVERVVPRVVGAAQGAAHLSLLVVAQPGPAVAAHVVEPADQVVPATDQQDALAGDLEAQPGPRLGQAFGPADVDPVAVEDALPVDQVALVGVVGGSGQRLPDRLAGGHADSSPYAVH